jgi:type IV pilus assembly protein PilO
MQNNEREVFKNRYLRYAEQVDMLPVYRAQTEIILERFGALLDAIPAALESIHVLSQVNRAARDSGVQLEFFKPLAEEVHGYYVVLPVEIRLRGDYNAIARFIELVSKMQHLVTVDLVMLASANHPNQIVLSSLLKAYRYKDLPKKSESRASRGTP